MSKINHLGLRILVAFIIGLAVYALMGLGG